jgi:hypothetical protein
MTQSFNLSQLANNLTSSGLLDAADGLVNAVPIANGGTGATTASGARTNLDVAQAVYAVPSGGIIMWSGSIASIPTGWLLCNGSSGTPDLRDRFVTGAGSTYAVASTGGSANAIVVSHNHTFNVTSSGQSVEHNHGINAYVGVGGTGAGLQVADNQSYETPTSRANTSNNSVDHSHNVSGTTATEGSSGTNANLPPFYALAFIMKS